MRRVKLSFDADTEQALATLLSTADVTVPPICPDGSAGEERRTKEHVERAMAVRVLNCLLGSGDLTFPLAVRHWDRPEQTPDFELRMPTRAVGLECTELSNPDYVRFRHYAARRFPDVELFDPGEFRVDRPKRSPADMDILLQAGSLTAPPYAGKEPEREWLIYLSSALKAKQQRLQLHYTLQSEQWLAIYDNLPLPIQGLDGVIWTAARAFQELARSVSRTFTSVFLLNDMSIWRLKLGKH